MLESSQWQWLVYNSSQEIEKKIFSSLLRKKTCVLQNQLLMPTATDCVMNFLSSLITAIIDDVVDDIVQVC